LRTRRAGRDRAAGACGVRGFGHRCRTAAAAGCDGAAAIADNGEAETNILAPRLKAPRAVDATPSEADLQAEE
jgi:hypothetical protein